jgi:hypothetical protein
VSGGLARLCGRVGDVADRRPFSAQTPVGGLLSLSGRGAGLAGPFTHFEITKIFVMDDATQISNNVHREQQWEMGKMWRRDLSQIW